MAVAVLFLTACGPAAAGNSAGTSTGWEVTVYYTAVLSLHHGPPRTVTGCGDIDCAHGNRDLGAYPDDFVRAVHGEGTGEIGDGRYLNWSAGVGYWLDTAPRDSHGRPLQPYVTAAADGLPDGTPVRLVDCGRQDDGSPVPADVCHRLAVPRWRILDEFTPGLGGPHHIDLYLGPETGPDFTEQPIYTTLVGATLAIG